MAALRRERRARYLRRARDLQSPPHAAAGDCERARARRRRVRADHRRRRLTRRHRGLSRDPRRSAHPRHRLPEQWRPERGAQPRAGGGPRRHRRVSRFRRCLPATPPRRAARGLRCGPQPRRHPELGGEARPRRPPRGRHSGGEARGAGLRMGADLRPRAGRGDEHYRAARRGARGRRLLRAAAPHRGPRIPDPARPPRRRRAPARICCGRSSPATTISRTTGPRPGKDLRPMCASAPNMPGGSARSGAISRPRCSSPTCGSACGARSGAISSALRAAGLIGADPLRLVRDHREVRRYRRAMSGAEGLASLSGPPASWQ